MSDPKQVHAFDQFGAGLRDLARALAAYHSELLTQGFTPEQALALVAHAQNTMLNPQARQ